LLSRLGASGSKTDFTPSDTIDSLIIIDRQVDLISPLLTQLTYEGLVDEIIGIKNCTKTYQKRSLPILICFSAHIELPTSTVNPSNLTLPSAQSTTITKEKMKKYHLDASSDPLFAEIRDTNYAHVPIRLNQVARQLSADYDVSIICLTGQHATS
jgi:vacuolar protein sorting-associated protein 33A